MSADAPTFDQALRAQILRNKPQRALSVEEMVQRVLPPHVPVEVVEVGICHTLVTAPAEHLNTIRDAVERGRTLGHRVDYVAMEQSP